MRALGHERRFRDVRDESGLPQTPERLRQRSESTLRASADSCSAAKRFSILASGTARGVMVIRALPRKLSPNTSLQIWGRYLRNARPG